MTHADDRDEGAAAARLADVHMRVTRDELAAIDANARLAGMSRTEFFVQCCARDRKTFELATVPGRDGPGASRAQGEEDPSPVLSRAKKDKQMLVRLSRADKLRIAGRARRAGKSMSEFVVRSALSDEVAFVEACDRAELARLYSELRRQGTNLNQIAAKINRIASVAWREDVSGELVSRLVREVTEDNEGTRACVNDAIRAVRRALVSTVEAEADAERRRNGDA